VSGVAEPARRADPFAVIGLPARTGLSDEDVRAAWRRIAAATHPDREDGGDPARFGAAAAAYVTLRTSDGRGEALADLGYVPATGAARRPGRHRGERGRVRRGSGAPGLLAGADLAERFTRFGAGAVLAAHVAAGAGGRGRGLAIRAVVAGAASAAAFLAAGWSPGTAGVLAGALSWLLIAGLRP
jgi:curved DNA-binding protein CbpA